VHALLAKIAETTILYLNAQIEAGVHVIQLFDTWAGELSPECYSEFALPYQQQVFQSLHRGPEGLGVPAILYVNECGAILEMMAKSGANVLSIDWRLNLDDARQRVGDKLALQGNLDPGALLGTVETISIQVEQMLRRGGDIGYVVNLGHGILPMTPVDNARAFVETAKKGIKEVA
jgi:uroporphyrinogen decarboxylase